MSDYEVSDSDYDYDENEKILLEAARKGRDNQESEEEVLGFQSSESEKDDFEEDIEDYEDDLPSAKAWGKRRKDFYNTDYVDEDFGGFQSKDAEDAEYEEQEARVIQERLMQELDETDYMLDFAQVAPSNEEQVEEKIKTDVSGLSKRDKVALFAKESPEFAGIIDDFKEKMLEREKKLEPIISLINSGKIPDSPICKFIKTKYHLILNYCTNIMYYLLLKARHVPVQSHPVIQRLFQYRQLLKQLETVNESALSQIDVMLQKINKGEEIRIENSKTNYRQNNKVTQRITKKKKEKKIEEAQDNNGKMENDSAPVTDDQSMDEEQEVSDTENARRAITYQIAKNKGLTPYRKKELRNPRVKHRMKYQKAKIRRKGQVREPRRELQKYGGEISGIKIGISKSIKLK